ncbi:MAG: molybdenum cofactor biosynthesis protein MoaE [Deltaproteobacteria bacterium]|nr:MAG: molybdenum cofactor biosynthesis protein MoaE [Deltaproteobacteria bacterium]
MFALTHDPIDIAAVRAAVVHGSCGALLVFEGLARDNFEGREVTELAYEAYPEMAIPELEAIGATIAERWGGRTAIVHRLGHVPVTEPTVVIAVATPHRAACYEASRYALETLKERVPIWKKEIYADGSAWKANAPA